MIEIYSELLKNLGAGILAEATLLSAEHLSQKADIIFMNELHSGLFIKGS